MKRPTTFPEQFPSTGSSRPPRRRPATAFRGISAVAVCAVLTVSCLDRSSKTRTANDGTQQDGYRYVHTIPDSLRTPEQQALYDLVLQTVTGNLRVENNHLAFPLSKPDFERLGIPGEYYDRLMHDLENANRYIDSTGIENMDSVLKQSYKDLYIKFGIE